MKQPLPQITTPWIDQNGFPTESFRKFMISFAALNFGPLIAAANDGAAATAGVQIGQLYQASGTVRVRLT